MLYNKIKLTEIPRLVFAHVYSCPGYESKIKKIKSTIEIAYVKMGEISIEIMGRKFVARENSFIVIPHSCEVKVHTPKNEPHIHYTISFEVTDGSVCDKNCAAENCDVLLPFLIENIPEHEKCTALLCNAINEFQKETPVSLIKSGALVCQLLCELGEKTCFDMSETDEKLNMYSERIKKYVKRNISSKIILQDIGDALGKNANYLNQIFRKKNGTPIISYVNLEKMKKAAVLISDEGCSVKEVARQVGINDVNYFSKLFKQKMGMSVQEYKMSSVDFSYSQDDENKI